MMVLFDVLYCGYYLQAYTNELEMEVAQLVEENARLKRQQQQVDWLNRDFFFLFLVTEEHSFGMEPVSAKKLSQA